MEKQELLTEFTERFITGEDSIEFYPSQIREFIERVWEWGYFHGIIDNS